MRKTLGYKYEELGVIKYKSLQTFRILCVGKEKVDARPAREQRTLSNEDDIHLVEFGRRGLAARIFEYL